MSRIDELWEGQEADPCPRCRGVCTYCLVGLRDRHPSHEMRIEMVNEGGIITTLHICDEHKRRITEPLP